MSYSEERQPIQKKIKNKATRYKQLNSREIIVIYIFAIGKVGQVISTIMSVNLRL